MKWTLLSLLIIAQLHAGVFLLGDVKVKFDDKQWDYFPSKKIFGRSVVLFEHKDEQHSLKGTLMTTLGVTKGGTPFVHKKEMMEKCTQLQKFYKKMKEGTPPVTVSLIDNSPLGSYCLTERILPQVGNASFHLMIMTPRKSDLKYSYHQHSFVFQAKVKDKANSKLLLLKFIEEFSVIP